MKNFLKGLSVLFVVIWTVSCNRNAVSLQKTNAEGEIKQLQNLVFYFDKALVGDSLLNRWDSTEYISFEPAIKGRFRWESRDELIFSPASPLPPATNFKARLNNELLQYSEYGNLNSKKDIVFYTPALQFEGANASWAAGESNQTKAYPRIDLYFNYPVDPASLKEKLKLSVDGTEPQ